jgi:hypothetical protein
VDAWPGFSVIGNLARGKENPAPLTVPALTVAAALPDDVIVTDCVADVLSWTLPKATLDVLNVRVGVAEFSVSANVFEILPAVAVRVPVWVELTAVAVAENPALVVPAAIVTEAGTVTALLLLLRTTVVALAAAEVRVTVHASVAAPVRDPLAQDKPLSVAGACPVPLSAIVAVPPLVALLLITIDPLHGPAVAGSKLMVNVAVWPGFSVTGTLIPDCPNPVPVSVAPLMVSAAVPDEVSVTFFVTVVFSPCVPNATLLLLNVSPRVIAFSVRARVFETPPAVAVRVAAWLVLTAVAVAVNPALAAPAGMVTEAGTVTALLLLARLTVVADVAAVVSPTVQASATAPLRELAAQENEFSVGVAAACPVPLRLTVAVAALLPIVTEPLKEPAVVGSNVTVNATAWPWFRVMGKLPPETAKPAPPADMPLMVSAPLPEDVTVKDRVVGVFRATVPNDRLVGLTVMADDEDPAGETFTVKVFEAPP